MARAAARRCRVGAVKTMSLLSFDSITLVAATLRGRPVLAASHGGIFVARAALRLGLGGLIVSDAGIGRERVGVAGLDVLEHHAVPAAAVHSCWIGDGVPGSRRATDRMATETPLNRQRTDELQFDAPDDRRPGPGRNAEDGRHRPNIGHGGLSAAPLL